MSTTWRHALHSVSYSGSWGQAALPPDGFLDRARELGFDGVMLMAKRPHFAPLDLNTRERQRLRSRLGELGLELQ